jgi:hypothetical protein
MELREASSVVAIYDWRIVIFGIKVVNILLADRSSLRLAAVSYLSLITVISKVRGVAITFHGQAVASATEEPELPSCTET